MRRQPIPDVLLMMFVPRATLILHIDQNVFKTLQREVKAKILRQLPITRFHIELEHSTISYAEVHPLCRLWLNQHTWSRKPSTPSVHFI
jgi:hypothetical protein